MFDRIAGLYDRMNSVMTAGLHHEWRRRAADLADLSPGRPRARRRHRHRRPRARAGHSRRAGWRGGRDRLRREDARARPGQGGDARVRFESGNALALDYADDEFDAATVGFGARNFSDLAARSVGDGAGRPARRPGRRARDHHPAAPAAVDLLRPVVRPRRPGARPRRRLARPTATCRARSSASRGRSELAARMWDVGLREIRYVLTAGGIIALHVGVGPDLMSTGRTGCRRRRGRGADADHGPRRAANGRARRRSRTRARALRRRHDLRRRQAPAPAARVPRRRRPAARDRRPRPRRGRGRARPRRDARPRRRARRLGAPPRPPDGGRHRRARGLATATGDLLFSRAFAELAGGDVGRRGPDPRRARAASWLSASWRSAPTRSSAEVSVEPLPRRAAG